MVFPILFFYRKQNIRIAQMLILMLAGMFFPYFAYIVAEIITGNEARVSSMQIGTQTFVTMIAFFGWLQLPLFKYLLDRIKTSALQTPPLLPR